MGLTGPTRHTVPIIPAADSTKNLRLGPHVFDITDDTLTIEVDENLYGRECLLRTAYWFTDRCYLLITRALAGRFLVHIKAKPATLERPVTEHLELIAGEFVNALLEHQLRQDIETQTGAIRELIVAKAFAESGLDEVPPGEVDDPVGSKQQPAHIQSSETDG